MTPIETRQKEWIAPEVKLLDQADDAKVGGGGPLMTAPVLALRR